ncbi:SulP family inorganic anion transporter [Leifsonia flava]|uniref:STAS domain-containing protein n=1 Tax=Orlajensenia leifsoniae TaxID=2561933 RepID=A0A4Y9R396_9MICO|nr:SulP family inorganic anion transporter [Leifsonia flava]TFV98036.1 STAS domain-containing protein [Leifsonia flava]
MTTAPTSSLRRWWLPTLVGYKGSFLLNDVIAGLSAGAVVVPQAMAYATIANLPVQVGLYTCMVPMLVYAMLGGSRAMSVSTTSTIATLTATTLVASGVAVASDEPSRDLMTLTLMVGVLLLLARLFKLGSLVEAINKPTIIGIQVGVGATVAVGQLPKLLGETSNYSGHGFIRSLIGVAEALPGANAPTIALSAVSIAVLLVLKRFAPRVPGPLIVVIGGILLVAFTSVTDAGVELIAEVPAGLPALVLPSFENVGALLPGALAIAVMAFLESAAVARGIRRAGETQIQSNQELLATAVASVAGSFFQSMPAAGGFSQSAVNQGAGARSQVSALVTVVLAVVVALFLGPVLSLLPQATLASMVIVAVIGLIDVRALVRLAHINPRDFWIALSTAVVGLVAGLLAAVAVGVVVTLAEVLHALNKVRVAAADRVGDVLVITVGNPMYTANVLETELAVLDAVDAARPVASVVLDVTRMRETSVTVLDALEDLDRELAETGVQLRLAGVPASAAEIAGRTEWYRGVLASGRSFATVEEAVAGPQLPPPPGS